MALATDQQVQNFVDQRTRPHAELARALLALFNDDVASIDDVFAALTQQNPTWTDQRKDGPPHLLVPTDVTAINTFMIDIKTAIAGHAQFPIILKACVRPVLG